MNKGFHVGIVDYETYLPEETINAEELSKLVNIPPEILRDKMGINRKHVGGPEDHAAMMGTKASKALLKRNNINPNDIDMILFAGETYCEYVCWTAAIKIQNELTLIIVSHRINSLKSCDKVYKIENKKIVEIINV